MSIVRTWEIRTAAQRPRSTQLRALDAAVQTWANQGQGPRDANMRSVDTLFAAWKNAQAAEYARIRAAADELDNAIAAVWSRNTTNVAGVTASQIAPRGWALVAYSPTGHGMGALLPAAQHVPALKPTEITKINESVARVLTATKMARDAMLTIAKRKNFTVTPMPLEEKAYTDFFGAFDQTRLNQIVANFQTLCMAFEGTGVLKPNFVDVRNVAGWSTTYGGCVRRDLRSRNAQGSLASLTAPVTMFVGRSFLGTGSYAKTTDDTVGTLLHEFAHGALNAVDVPDVDAAGNFLCTVQSTNPRDANFGNSTDMMNHQCSTEALDMILASFKPEYAIVNADSYGQFTRRILVAKGG